MFHAIFLTMNYFIRILIGLATIVLVPELAKQSKTLGPLVLSLPLTSLATYFVFLQSGEPADQIADFSISTFWFLLPSLLLFPCVYGLIHYARLTSAAAVVLSIMITAAAYAVTNRIVS